MSGTTTLIIVVVIVGAFALIEAQKAQQESGLGGGISQIIGSFSGGATTSPLAALGL